MFFKPFKEIWNNKKMILQIAQNDVKIRYAGSFFGIFWGVLYPLLFLGCYALIYVFVFNVRFEFMDSKEYVILIFSGLIPFIAFQEAISMGIGSVISNVSLMKNTMFPIEFVPVKTVVSALTTQITGLGMILIALTVMNKLTWMIPAVFVMFILQLMFNIGLVWILSSLNVLFRDLQNIITIIIMLLMMVSPIAYPINFIPQNLQPFLKVNPMYYIISCYQEILMFGRWPKAEIFLPFLIMSVLFFVVGYNFFMKMKRVFTDNV